MTNLNTAIVAFTALARLDRVHMVEIGPQHNYQTEMLRNDAYRWAKRSGQRVTTSTERDAHDPYLSVLRVRLVEGR